MLTLSGPVELLFLLCFIAAWTYVVVSDYTQYSIGSCIIIFGTFWTKFTR